MSRDGQGARDYGTHLVPGSVWEYYDWCPRCGASRGKPCFNLRYKDPIYARRPDTLNWVAHRDRPLVSVLDTEKMLNQMNTVPRRGWTVTDITRRDAVRAMNSVVLPGQFMTGRARWNLVPPVMHRGFKVTAPEIHAPWSRSTHASGYLSHMNRGALMAWRNGILIATQIRWRCGARSLKFRLMAEPDSVICPACKIERVPREREGERSE